MLTRTKSAHHFVAMADKARDRRDWTKAVEFYAKALAQDDQLAEIWVQYGHAQKESGSIADAIASYFRAAAITPDDAEVYLQLGHAFKVLGDIPQAMTAYEKSVEKQPIDNDAVRELNTLRMVVSGADSVADMKKFAVRHSVSTPLAFSPQAVAPAEMRDYVDFTVAGRLGNENGIQMHSNAFISIMSRMTSDIQIINTRPNDCVESYVNGLRPKPLDDVNQARPSVVSVFCDVVANSADDMNYMKIPKSIVSYAYAVFDSSRIPEYWVDRLNKFDAVLVPDECLLPVLVRSGVFRPAFVLPLALDYSDLQQNTHRISKGGDVITFGCLAGFGARKNIKELIEAFVDVFGDNEGVRLRVHSPLNFSNHFEHLQEHLRKLGCSNVELTCSALSRERYAALLKTFDIYINVSKGEGFSITPREALYLGIPTILSDNTAHRTINKSGLTIAVPTQGYELALYEAMGGEIFGIQCCPDKNKIRHAFSRALVELPKLSSRAHEMKRFAEMYSFEHLRWRYESIARPKDVFIGKENKITSSHIVTTDGGLYEKLSAVRAMVKRSVPHHDRQRITVIGNDGGFFSLFNTYVSYLVWNIGRPEVASIIPDWRVTQIQKYRKLDKFTSLCYGKRIDGNLWLKFFHPVPGQDVSLEQYNEDSFLTDAIIYDRFNEENEPDLTYVHAYKLYKSPEFASWRHWYAAYVRKFVKFRERLTSQADLFEAENFNSELVIGCHVRHPSHSIEQPGGKLPTVELFQQIIIERTAGIKNWKVFLATDQQSVIESFVKIFGRRVVYRSDVARVQERDDRAYDALSASDKAKEGHQIQHLTASDEARWNTRMGDEVIVDALLLAKCDCFVHVTSNIATAVSFLNPEIEMIYCE